MVLKVKIMTIKTQVKDGLECGRLRQILERGYLSSDEIQFVIDATSREIYKR